MKRLIWVLAIMIGSSTYAQKEINSEENKKEKTTVVKHKLRSPEFKNYKPWQHKSTTETVATTEVKVNSKRNLSSPEFKNYKPWQHKDNSQVVTIKTSTRKKLRSSEHKNYKPWRD